MKSRFSTVLSFSVAALMLGATVLASSASAKTIKIATMVPDGHSWLVEMRKAADAIKTQTEGRVKLKFYPGGVMGNDKTVLRKIRAGQLHGGAFSSGSLAPIYPDIELYSLPLLFRSYSEVDAVREVMDPLLAEGLAKKGYVTLAISDAGFAYVHSQKPIRKLEDMEGTKVWLPEDDIMSEITLDLAGVSPVPLPIADVYTALQTGLIDTVAGPTSAAIAFQWHTKVNYLTDVPLMYLVGIFAVDGKTFNKLSAGDQAVFRKEIANASARLDSNSRAGETNARDALANQGIEFVRASSDAEIARWHGISGRAIEQIRALNRYSDPMIDQMLEILAKFREGESEAAGNATAD
jgi:TRAP-type C4-dicarboxylate transport system substrate-binding protein